MKILASCSNFVLNHVRLVKLKAGCLFSFLWFVTNCSIQGASVVESSSDADGWKGISPREELRPTFERLASGGPSGRGSLIIRADEREGLDGHWAKTFPVEGGHYYHFRAVRRVTTQ